MSFKSVSTFHNHAIDQLTAKLAQQQDLCSSVQRVLPEALATHIVHCVAHDTTLMVYTDAAVWSSQLRFYKEAMLASVASRTKPTLTQVTIRLLSQK